MSGRLFRILALTAALFPIVATIGAPEFDGLARAVSTLFRDNQPASPAPHAVFPAPEWVSPIASVSPIEIPGRSLQDTSAMPRREGPLEAHTLQVETPSVVAAPVPDQKRGALLTSMYVSFITLQALDAHSTLRALDRGAVESNPLVEPFAGNPTALIALKAGTTVGVLYMTERVRRHNRVASIVIMAAANSVYATIVARNYRIGSIAR